MAISKLIKLLGILGLAGLGGCALAQTKEADDTYFEATYNEGEQDSLTSRAEVKDKNGKKKFVVDHTHLNSRDNTSTKIGMNQQTKGDLYEGQFSIYGDTNRKPHETDSNRMAFGFRGKSPALNDLMIGGAVEKTSTPSGDKDLFNAYVGKQIDNSVFKAGYANIDGKDTYQAGAHTLLGNVFAGVGGRVNTDGKGVVIGDIRVCPEKKGEDCVLEVKGFSDLEGMVNAKAIFGTKSKKGKYCGFHDLDDNGVNDVSSNVADYRPGFDSEYGDFVTTLQFVKNGEDKTYALRTYKAIGDLGPLKNITVGGGATFKNLVDNNVTSYNGNIQTDIGPLGVYFEANKEEGKPTEYSVYVWTDVSKIVNLFKGGKKKWK